MGEAPLTVRLFVQTQTYDIPCDPRQPAQWLLIQAKNIQRANAKRAAANQPQQPNQQLKQSPNDELEVLYNRTTRSVLDLGDPIGKCISPMDVVDARTLLQTPDTTFTSAMFPWLRSYPGDLQQLSDDAMDATNGLFFQQLYAYTLIGKRTPQLASQRKEQQHRDAFHALLETYVRGSFGDDNNGHHRRNSNSSNSAARFATPVRDAQSRRSSAERPPSGSQHAYYTAQSPSYGAPPRRLEFPADAHSSTDSDTADEPMPLRISAPVPNSPYHPSSSKHAGGASPTSPSLTASTSSPGRRASASDASLLEDLDTVFDIVFKQQAIGMKLGADESRHFAVVKECFENSEAARYPEIQNGVVILAVNGQEVAGLGLSRILYRLREAPRPVVVRFGRISNRQHPSTGTWG